MTLPISPEERTLLESLDRIVYSPDLQLKLQPIVSRVRAQLAVEKQAVMTWEPIAMSTFGDRLPPRIQSGWVFILREGVNTGAERHPNSHQRMMSFIGTGEMQTREKPDSPWTSTVLVSDRAKPLEQRWISIPPNVWHQPVTPRGEDWVVVSFHTVPAKELIEERPAEDESSGTKQMRYAG
jgi:hypothetical protein